MHLLCIVKYFAIFHQIKDDAKNGLYVENVTEEYVTSYDDVTQILIKVGGVECACVFCFISIIFHLFRVNHCNSGFIWLTFLHVQCRDFQVEKWEQPL